MSDARSSSYETHFYCALCGGPFAQVFRTAESPATPSYAVRGDHNANSCGGKDEHGNHYDEDLDLDNGFNILQEDNQEIPEEVVLNNMSHAAKRSRILRLHAEKEGRRRGIMSKQGTTRQAYDGKRISTKQIKWTKHLRALIHKRAIKHPLNHQYYLANNETAYLTGRGLIRREQNLADAFASIDEDEGDGNSGIHMEHPIFSDEDRLNNTYGFHVYQELGREDCRYVISSIPFHDECWSLLDLAIEESGKERGVARMNERIDMDDLWGYLQGLVTVTGVINSATVPYSTAAALQEEHRGGEIITRPREVDYREGQGSGDGWQWKHEEGLHWLAADPSSISVLDSPLLLAGGPQSRFCAPRAALQDPFQSLPPEILLEVCKLLTSTDIFSLKTATPAVHNLYLPDSFYRRFLGEEFQYLPTLVKEVKGYESARCRRKLNRIDWKGSFERLRKLMMTPNGHGNEWSHVDICLKNRNRIWKIVKPMADELVESSDAILRYRYKAPKLKAEKTGVVRGYAGVRTGKEGTTQSVYFGPRERPPLFKGEDEKTLEIAREVGLVRIWLDGENGPLCGLGFFICNGDGQNELQRLGRRGSSFVDLEVWPKILTGFVFCLANHIICGVQLVYNDKHTFSRRIGQWDGSARKIVVPIQWRKLVGVTGFINSSGFIETLGILEETLDYELEDRVGHLPTPSPTVNLTHKEASVWKKLPPANKKLILLEREGPRIMDWRMCMGEWEIWENGYHEEGVDMQPPKDKSLVEIVGYYDDVALRGLEFIYSEHKSRRRITSVLGSKIAAKRDSIRFKDGESMAAVVICFGDACVHGILFVTESGCTSEVFGPRYLGTHKVFAPTANIDGPSQTIFRTETTGKIVGLHCLYDQEENKFLQLGLVLLEESEQIYEHELPCSIPFNEMGDNCQVWDDGPPPKEWSIGYRRPGDMGISDKTSSDAQYSGWVGLEYLRKITIYGKMKGIRFSFSDARKKDKFFGYVDAENEDIYIQNIDYEHGERIAGIAILLNDGVICHNSQKVESMDDVSNKEDPRSSLGRIHFLTNRNQANFSLAIKYRVSCRYLVAIKFDFNYHQLVSWAPIYAPVPDSVKLVSEMIQYPWKCRSDDIVPNGEIKTTSRVACIFFDYEEDQCVDAVKGYVSMSGHFCGLVFRRNGNWEDKVFGHRSAYELTMELSDGERITSLYLPDENTGALALCTNFDRTTPWFGKAVSEPISLQKAPEGEEAVGIYGTLDKDTLLFNTTESIVLDTVGLLYRPKKRTSSYRDFIRNPTPPRPSGFQLTDEVTKLPWFSDITDLPTDLQLAPLAAQRPGLYLGRSAVGRACTIFDPSQLNQILVFVNLFNRAGITSIRFRGTEKMGLITMGEWPDREDIRIKRRQRMNILGVNGERIVRVRIAFQRLESEDRVVGLAIETDSGRSETIVRSEMFPKNPNLSAHNVKILECGDDNEIVGFHGIFSTYNIHDIGLVLRRKTAVTPGPVDN